ncbi:hypothetical protein HMPREF1199_01378 [Hoylesella oralis CC98A]|nr:hypothetical protein HMPREF1199_01378 [Hoylesella oralis CC98A]
MPVEVNIMEDNIFWLSPGLLGILLKDHTTSKEDVQHNIFWVTSDYEYLGDGYLYGSPILPHLITGDNGHVIMPRVLKSRDTQSSRSRDMAEVFTLSWICNAQNNLIDEAWFGQRDVFTEENTDEQGCHRWKHMVGNIVFPEDKSWKDYVSDTRLEITCGEAPYIVSRYDTTTGEAIPIEQRIGLLDRKLRVVSVRILPLPGNGWNGRRKHTKAFTITNGKMTISLIARESMLISFIEYYQQKFGKQPLLKSINYIAYIIA